MAKPILNPQERLSMNGEGLSYLQRQFSREAQGGIRLRLKPGGCSGFQYLFEYLPHIDEILCASFDDFIKDKKLLVLTHRLNEAEVVKVKNMMKTKNVLILDLARTKSLEGLALYSGISW
jgi:hypothetical protein